MQDIILNILMSQSYCIGKGALIWSFHTYYMTLLKNKQVAKQKLWIKEIMIIILVGYDIIIPGVSK